MVIFDQVSRMSRDAEEGFQVYEELYNKGVILVFIKEPHINTETYKAAMAASVPMTGTNVDCILEGVNKYLMLLAKEQIRLAFEQAEKEVEDTHQRTREGLREVKRRNEELIFKYGSEEEARKDHGWKQVGQVRGAKLTTKKSISAKKTILEHSKDFGGSLSDPEVIKLTGLARGTYYKYKRELKQNSETR